MKNSSYMLQIFSIKYLKNTPIFKLTFIIATAAVFCYISVSAAETTTITSEDLFTTEISEKFNKTKEDIVLIGANGGPVLANQPPGKIFLKLRYLLFYLTF